MHPYNMSTHEQRRGSLDYPVGYGEKKPSDGEIYFKLRQCQREMDGCSDQHWLARLSPHGIRVVKQLSRRKEFTSAFDDLLCIPGLWDGMRISTLNKMFAMKCDEVRNTFQCVLKTNQTPGSFMLSQAY